MSTIFQKQFFPPDFLNVFFSIFRRNANIFCAFTHTVFMKITTILCCSLLIAFGLFACIYALTGFNLLLFLCLGNAVVFRSVLSLAGVCALWLLFWLIAFRPTKSLS